MDQREIRVLFL